MKEMMTIVSDEYREGYAAFFIDNPFNPYIIDSLEWDHWETGYAIARMYWKEMIGEKSV